LLRKPFGPEELQAVLQQVTAPRAVSESAAE
jgi:hypothetical protein